MGAIDAIRAAIASRERVGPRIVAGVMVDGPTPVWPVALAVRTAEEGRQAVASIVEAGADFAKVYTLLPREAYLGHRRGRERARFPIRRPRADRGHGRGSLRRRAAHASSTSATRCCRTVRQAEDEILAELRAAAAGPDPVQAYATAFFGTLPRLLATIDPGKVEALATRFVTNQTWVHPDVDRGTQRGACR